MIKVPGADTTFPDATGNVSSSRIWEASQDVSMTMTESFFQSSARAEAAKWGDKLTPEQANKKYPGLNADRDIMEGEAVYLSDWKKEKAEKQKIIDSASDSFLRGTALPFIAGAVESLVDPAEMAIGFLTGGIGNGLAKGAGLATKIGIDFAEAGVSQIIAEVPIMNESNKSFEKYTAKQFAQNALMASVLQVGMVHGGSAAFKGTAKALGFAGEKTTENLIRMQKTLESNGVNSTPVLNKMLNRITKLHTDTDLLNGVTGRHFPDVLEEGMDNRDMLTAVFKKFDEGVIDEKQLQEFVDDAFQSGVDPEVMALAVDDSAMQFGDEFVNDIKATADDIKNERWYDDTYYEELDQMESKPPETYESELSSSINEKLDSIPEADLDETFDFGDEGGGRFSMKEIKEEVRIKKAEQDFLKEYAACLRGAV